MEFLKIWEILLRRKWIVMIVFSIFFLTSIIGTSLVTPTYKASAKLLIETPDALTSLMASLGMQSSTKSASGANTYDTDIALAKIRPLLKELISSLKLKDKGGDPLEPDKLVSKTIIDRIFPSPYIKVNQYRDADIIEILAFSTSPSEASNMANKLAELYISHRIFMVSNEFMSARLDMGKRIEKLKEDYYSSLLAMKDFKMVQGVADLSSETQNLTNKLVSLKNSYEENEALIQKYEVGTAMAEEKIKELKLSGKQAEHFTSDLLKSLKSKLNDLLLELSAKSADITKEHPDYKKLEKQIATVKGLLLDDAKTFIKSESYSADTLYPLYQSLATKLVENYIDREVALAKRSLFKRYIDKYQAELLSLPGKSVESSKLELAITTNKNTYQKLLEYLTQAGVAESITLSKIKVVDAAVTPDKPDSPRRSLNYLIGVFLGLFWGLALAFFMEYIDNTVKSAAEIKNALLLDPLGTIPKTRTLEAMGIISGLDQTLPEVEAYRTLKNSIMFKPGDRPVKTIVVTSSSENEGKSSLASNLAISFGAEERRAVLVDLNLREPSLDRYFKLAGNKGFTDAVSGGMGLRDVIVRQPANGVDVLLSGTATSEPGRLIDSQGLKEIIRSLQEAYDIVIIDTPSVTSADDAAVAGRLADGVLLVIEHGKTTIPVIENSIEAMKRAGVNFFGAVLNKA